MGKVFQRVIRQTKPARMSAKKLASLGGKIPFTTITGKRKAVKRKSGKQRRVMGREKLYNEAKTARRREIFERSKGYCEAEKSIVAYDFWGNAGVVQTYRCYKPITWETMEWSHKRHAANKDDSLEGGIASCRECHEKQHNAGGKPITVRKKDINGNNNSARTNTGN